MSAEKGNTQGRASETQDPDTLIVESIGTGEVHSIMRRLARRLDSDDDINDLLLVLTAVAGSGDENRRGYLLDHATRPLLPFHGGANDALKAALVARARAIQAA